MNSFIFKAENRLESINLVTKVTCNKMEEKEKVLQFKCRVFDGMPRNPSTFKDVIHHADEISSCDDELLSVKKVSSQSSTSFLPPMSVSHSNCLLLETTEQERELANFRCKAEKRFDASYFKTDLLHSSIYGASASNIENVLPGLKIDNMKILGEKYITVVEPKANLQENEKQGEYFSEDEILALNISSEQASHEIRSTYSDSVYDSLKLLKRSSGTSSKVIEQHMNESISENITTVDPEHSSKQVLSIPCSNNNQISKMHSNLELVETSDSNSNTCKPQMPLSLIHPECSEKCPIIKRPGLLNGYELNTTLLESKCRMNSKDVNEMSEMNLKVYSRKTNKVHHPQKFGERLIKSILLEKTLNQCGVPEALDKIPTLMQNSFHSCTEEKKLQDHMINIQPASITAPETSTDEFFHSQMKSFKNISFQSNRIENFSKNSVHFIERPSHSDSCNKTPTESFIENSKHSPLKKRKISKFVSGFSFSKKQLVTESCDINYGNENHSSDTNAEQYSHVQHNSINFDVSKGEIYSTSQKADIMIHNFEKTVNYRNSSSVDFCCSQSALKSGDSENILPVPSLSKQATVNDIINSSGEPVIPKKIASDQISLRFEVPSFQTGIFSENADSTVNEDFCESSDVSYNTCSLTKSRIVQESVSQKMHDDQNAISSVSMLFKSPIISSRIIRDDIKSSLNENQTFQSPSRPNSLSFSKKPLTMVGSTLISPDTPRPKKNCIQLYINGHAYTYLGLKCSTRSTYCCIYQPQPMFVLQENNPNLSMYSNWQVVPSKEEFSDFSPGQMIALYNSKQHHSNSIYSSAELNASLSCTQSLAFGLQKSKNSANIPCTTEEYIRENHPVEKCQGNNICDGEIDGVASTYRKHCNVKRIKVFEGGFKSNEDYTYIRGRGRGKYVCEECGIRCKKPSMLKKHIRTHTDLRPYKCRYCSFAFKTKGNLTKHMKSKAHYKKCTEFGSDDIQKSTPGSEIEIGDFLCKQDELESSNCSEDEEEDLDDSESLDEDFESDCSSSPALNTKSHENTRNMNEESSLNELHIHSVEEEAARSLLHLSSFSEGDHPWCSSGSKSELKNSATSVQDEFCISLKKPIDQALPDEPVRHRPRSYSANVPQWRHNSQLHRVHTHSEQGNYQSSNNERSSHQNSEFDIKEKGLRRFSISVAREAQTVKLFEPQHWENKNYLSSFKANEEQPMDLRISRTSDIVQGRRVIIGSTIFSKLSPLWTSGKSSDSSDPVKLNASEVTDMAKFDDFEVCTFSDKNFNILPKQIVDEDTNQFRSSSFTELSTLRTEQVQICDQPDNSKCGESFSNSPLSPSCMDDALVSHEIIDVCRNTEEQQSGSDFIKPGTSNMEEGKCVCRICNKIFAKAGQLRIHVNIHYFERPFRCENCGVSFRTKGHLQKHKRSVSHYNKVNMNMTFGTPSVDNPRPFKCSDCKIAFRIHGHLAKHLRSKMHIMKLECLGKLPFGMYAEMERSGVSLNEIDTTDCNNSLESLQTMAQKLYQRDPRRMRWQQDIKSVAEIDKFSAYLSMSKNESVSEKLSVNSTMIADTNLKIIEKDADNSGKGELCTLQSPIATSKCFITSHVQENVSLSEKSENEIKSLRIPVCNDQRNFEDSASSMHRSDTCHLCGRMFKSAKFLQVHLYCDHSSWDNSAEFKDSTNLGEEGSMLQDLACSLCGKQFADHSDLQQHLQSHAQPRPFVCEVCDAGFTSSVSLIAHLSTHQPVSQSSTT